jgi:general secretion pathway protein B
MSYILEALKKSQSDRELGQVPRVQGFGIDVPVEQPGSHPWAYLAIVLVLAALGLGGFALLRGLADMPAGTASQASSAALPVPMREDGRADWQSARAPAAVDPALFNAAPAALPDSPALPPPLSEPAAPPMIAPGTTVADGIAAPASTPVAVPATAESARPQAATLEQAPGWTQAAAAPGPSSAPLPLTDPDALSVEPEVLVVPAPAKPGEPLPRGAEELRRAVLGDGGSLSASVDGPAALPAPPAPDVPLPTAPPESDQVPVPDDLLAEIEAFKELVRKRDPEATRQAAATPPPLPEPPGLRLSPPSEDVAVPPAPSLELRNRLPPFSMTVHVYNPDPSRRFVYINGRKISETQQSREGLRLERVLTDGAVLSYDGERFFQRR